LDKVSGHIEKGGQNNCVYVAALSCSFVNQWNVAAGGAKYVMTVAGDGCKHFVVVITA